MKEQNNILNDDKLRELLQGTKLKASENLQYRIMHQITTEQSLRYRKVKSTRPLLKSMSYVAAVFYIFILALAVFNIQSGGLEALASKSFILSAACIAIPCAIYGLVITLDEKRYLK